MSRIKSLFSIASLAALSVIMLVGCNEDRPQEAQEKTTTEQQEKKQKQQVNVYSARLPDLIEPIFSVFTKKTGIKVNFIFLKQGILERLKSEGEFTPADLVLVSDIGSIHDIVNAKLVRPIKSEIVTKNIPEHYRSSKNLWVGLTGRIRMLVRTSKKLPINITGYDALSDPAMKGRVCTRSLTHPYNVSLVASYLNEHTTEETQIWLKGFYENLFDKPSGNDSGQIDLIASGLCDLAPINHYYYERMLKVDKKLPTKARLVSLEDMTDGIYANVSGIMLSKYAQNTDNALKLIEFMTKQTAQKIFAEHDLEFPLNPHVAAKSEIFKSGTDNIASIPLDEIAENRQEALELIYKIQK
ncbi:MAG: iron(III) transport system substrate-binding protein [Alphaproteobacteria bacterium]|jgi:iron(III) transport system substrate-binding protein